MKKLLVFLLLFVNSAFLYAADYSEGTHYKKLHEQQPTSTGDKIEVLEFFWYGCPHCYHFEPFIKAWNKDKAANVEFVRVPAIFRPDWEVQARAYYALSNMGVIEDVHEKIFEAIHKYKQHLNTMQAMADFLEKKGVNRDQFINEFNSFSVDGMVRKAKKKQQGYKIEGVPAVAVNGKYLTSGSMAGSYDNLIKIINYLVEIESK
ncbi:MAG: thiol:disulfide interchange protein DsbA/DsbL [Gammaproteobacteria bacterium]|jgi:thiol:disulfide interchange protein DsbA|nr:thiol:disulfide interchange protein DsbA/DsbL [Gammaproteobacteria bacterium]